MCTREYVISIGSNCEDGRIRVENSIAFLHSFMMDVRVSSVYSTPSITSDGSIYTNAVICGRCDIECDEIVRICKEYERSQGRIRVKGSLVTIDLDVVMMGSKVLRPKDVSREYFIKGFNEISDSMAVGESRCKEP